MRIFPKQEYDSRYSRLREAMNANGIDTILAYNPKNVSWLTGFLGTDYTKRYSAFASGTASPRAIFNIDKGISMIAVGGEEQAIRQETYVDDIITHLPHKRIDAIIDRLIDMRVKKVGLDLAEYESITVKEYNILEERLNKHGIELVDATDIIRELKMVKSERELEKIRIATDIQNRAFSKFFSRISKNMSEVEIEKVMLECQFESGSTELGVAVPWTHPGYAFFRRQYPDRVMKDKDLQWIDGGAVYHGYSSDYDMIYVFGEPDDRHKKAYKIMQDVFKEGIEYFKPNRRIVDIAQDIRKVMKKHDAINPLEPEIFIGHSLGYNMVEEPYLASWSDKDLTLKPNMAFAAEWFIATEYGPILYEENFVVREDTIEMISSGYKLEGDVISIR